MDGIYISGGFPQLVINLDSPFWNLTQKEKNKILCSLEVELHNKMYEWATGESQDVIDTESDRWRGANAVVARRDGNECRYCGDNCGNDPTIDHVFPSSRGGADTPDNMVIACRKCNSKKGARTPQEAGMVLR